MTAPAVLAVAIAGIVLYLLWQRSRSGVTIVLDDDVTLRSGRLRLSGRPDRIIRKGKTLIPIEKKSGRKVHDPHRVQLGIYFLLMEDITGKRPPYGFIALADGREVKVRNTARLRATVGRCISELRNSTGEPTPFPAKCAKCSVRSNCAFRK